MTKQSADTAAPLVLSRPTERPKVRQPAKRGNALAVIALVIGLASIALQFQAPILSQIERAAGSQPWVRELYQMLAPMVPKSEVAAVTPVPETTEAASQAATDFGAAYDDIRASLAALGQAVERLDEAALDDVTADDLAEVKSQLTVLAEAQATVQGQTAQQIGQVEALLADHDRRLAVVQQSPMASLMVARVALVSATGTVSAREVELLATAAALDPALSESVATLKVLAGQDIVSLAALRDQFADQREAALSAARSAQLEWWEAGLSSVQTTASDWGLAGPRHHSKDDIAVENAAHRLDVGDLTGALFELEAASPEIKDALRLWLDQAQLRVTFDETLLQLVDALIHREGKSPGSSSSGG